MAGNVSVPAMSLGLCSWRIGALCGEEELKDSPLTRYLKVDVGCIEASACGSQASDASELFFYGDAIF